MAAPSPSAVIRPIFPRGAAVLPGCVVFYHDPRLATHRQPRGARVSGYGAQDGTVHLHIDLCPVLDAGKPTIITAKNVRLLNDYPSAWPNEPFCVLPGAEAGTPNPSSEDAAGGNRAMGLDADLALGNLPGKPMPADKLQPLAAQEPRGPAPMTSRAIAEEGVQLQALQELMRKSEMAGVPDACRQCLVSFEILPEDASNPKDIIPAAIVFTNQHGLVIAQVEVDDSGSLTLYARTSGRRDLGPVLQNVTSFTGISTLALRIVQIAQSCRKAEEPGEVLRRTVILVQAWAGAGPMPVPDDELAGDIIEAQRQAAALAAGRIDINTPPGAKLQTVTTPPAPAGGRTRKKPGK